LEFPYSETLDFNVVVYAKYMWCAFVWCMCVCVILCACVARMNIQTDSH